MSTNGKELYQNLADQIDQQTLVTKYSEGTTAFRNRKYSDAIDALKAVVDIDDTYDNGEAMYELAEAYENNGDTDKALKYYKKVAKDYANFYRGRNSARKVEELQNADSSSNTQ